MPKSGVYGIKFSDKRIYVGQASHITLRWTNHRHHLRRGTHHCTYLQRMWNKYRENRFTFVILELCSVDYLNRAEIKWWKKYKREGKLINTHPPGKQARGYTHTASARAKMSESAIRVGSSIAERKKRSDRAKRQWLLGNFGRKIYKVRKRTCKKCGILYYPPRFPEGTIRQSKYCARHRPKLHLGGNYKYREKL